MAIESGAWFLGYLAAQWCIWGVDGGGWILYAVWKELYIGEMRGGKTLDT